MRTFLIWLDFNTQENLDVVVSMILLGCIHKLKEFKFYLCLIFRECIPNCLDKGLNFITFI